MATMTKPIPVLDPIVRQTAWREGVLQFLVLGSIALVAYWLFGITICTVVLLLAGFAINAAAVASGAMSTNVQLAELRDQIKEMMHHSRPLGDA